MDLITNALDIRKHMGSAMGSEDVNHHKPDPEIYLTSAKRLGVPIERCVVFEDSFSGVSAGINAGMKVVGVLSSHEKGELPPCDLYISDYTEITAIDIIELLSQS